MLEDGAEADPEELREAMMEAVKEFMEENSETEDAVNFLEGDELEEALGGNLNFTLEPMDTGTNFLGELPITSNHFLNHLPFPPPLRPPPDTVSQVGLLKLRLQLLMSLLRLSFPLLLRGVVPLQPQDVTTDQLYCQGTSITKHKIFTKN